jgi:hypothetical protein
MPRVCTVCSSPDRDAIDAAIVSGAPSRRIAVRYGVGATSIRRHARAHLSPAIVAAQDAVEEERGQTLAERLEGLYVRAHRILEAAESGHSGTLGLAAIRELRGIAELLGRLSGELRPDSPTVQVLNLQAAPEWVAARTALLDALAPYPDARLAVVEALRALPSYPETAPARRSSGATIAPWRPELPAADPEDQAPALTAGNGRYNAAEDGDA